MNEAQVFASTTPGLTTGLMLIVLMIMFVALCIWAWSAKQKPAFDQASLLPLEELAEDIIKHDNHNDVPGNGMITEALGSNETVPQTPASQTKQTPQTVIIKHLYSTH